MQGLSRFLLAAIAGLASIDSAVAVTKSPGCGKAPSKTYSATSLMSFTSGGQNRQYLVKVPDNYNNNNPYRLIFTLHALGGTATQIASGAGGYYGLPPLINDTAGAIYIAPQGISNGWQNTNNSDVTFLSALATAVEADLCIDTDRRFSTGFSYGAAMSYALACTLGKQLRAVAVLSGSPQISGCKGGTDPVAYFAAHGVGDTVLPISGARQMVAQFAKNNGCTAQTAPEPASGAGTHIKTEFKGCTAGYPVTFITFDGPHTPSPTDKGQSKSWAPEESWKFFSQFQ